MSNKLMILREIVTLVFKGHVNPFRIIYYNKFCSWIKTESHYPITLHSNSIFELGKDIELHIKDNLDFGRRNYPGTKKETRLQLRDGAKMIVDGHYRVYAGCNITVCENSKLILHPGYINEDVTITCGSTVEIGEGTSIARGVVIWNNDAHEIIGSPNQVSEPIMIGKHVWICTGAKILKGVTIGDGAIIAAGAIVTKNIPARCLAAGIPAKVIRENVEWK